VTEQPKTDTPRPTDVEAPDSPALRDAHGDALGDAHGDATGDANGNSPGDAQGEAHPLNVSTEAPAEDVASPHGYVDFFCVIHPDLLLMVGWFPGGDGALELLITDDTGQTTVPAHCVAYVRSDIPLPDVRAGKICVARLPTGMGPLTSLAVRWDGDAVSLHPSPITPSRLEPDALATRLAQFDPRLQDAAMRLLQQTIQTSPTGSTSPLQSRQLARLHSSLRVTHQTTSPGKESTGLVVETLIQIDAQTYYLTGWVWSTDASPTQLTMVSPEGFRAEILPSLHRFPRPDIEQLYGVPPTGHYRYSPGFSGVFTLPPGMTSTRSQGWTVELHDDAWRTFEAPCPRVVRDERVAVDAMLALLGRTLDGKSRAQLLSDHVGPGIRRARRASTMRASIHDVLQFGPRPAAPSTSLVFTVPDSVQMVQHQLSALAADPQVHTAELIYCMPALRPDVDIQHLLRQWFDLYRLPFTVVLHHNADDRATRLNLGLDVARAKRVVLGSAGLIPQAPGWVSDLNHAFDTEENVGLVAPVLLNIDDTIDSAGLDVRNVDDATGDFISVRHAGLAVSSLPDAPAVEVGAASIDGAMIDRQVLIDIGRIPTDMLSDDLASVKVAMALARHGLKSFYRPGVRLYRVGRSATASSSSQAYDRWNLTFTGP